MTTRKPLPEIARCDGMNPTVLVSRDVDGRINYHVEDWRGWRPGYSWRGPYRRSERAAILAWNRVMEAGSRYVTVLRENIALRLEQFNTVKDTSEYKELLKDRQRQVIAGYKLEEKLKRIEKGK